MTVDRSADELAPVQSTATAAPPALEHRPGRWIANWDAEDKGQWEAEGRSIAKRNLYWSIFAEFLGFVVWQLWSIVVVQLPAAGFQFDTNQIFWLISIPQPRRRHAPHPLHVHGSQVRWPELDHRLGAAPADPPPQASPSAYPIRKHLLASCSLWPASPVSVAATLPAQWPTSPSSTLPVKRLGTGPERCRR